MFEQHSLKRSIFALSAFAILLGFSLLGFALLESSATATTEHSSAQPIDSAAWKALSRSEQKDYMRDTVMPRMEQLFQSFDAKKFSHFKCTACHGDGARTGTFKMPDAKIPKIPGTAAGLAKLEAKMPAMMRFMRDTVTPEMARLLGVKTYDCEGCHKLKK